MLGLRTRRWANIGSAFGQGLLSDAWKKFDKRKKPYRDPSRSQADPVDVCCFNVGPSSATLCHALERDDLVINKMLGEGGGG